MLCAPSMALIGLGILTHVTLRTAPSDRTYYDLYFFFLIYILKMKKWKHKEVNFLWVKQLSIGTTCFNIKFWDINIKLNVKLILNVNVKY